MKIWVWIPSFNVAVMIAIFALVLFMLSFPLVAYIVYVKLLKRTSREKWSRECSDEDPVQKEMFDEGIRWLEAHKDKRVELHMVNEGFNLFAEYIDLGYDKAVIVVPGRSESLRYGYYFAKPYAESGYNILVMDQRAHGDSDGKYNTVGNDEHRDLMAWARLIHERFGVNSIVLHGICIGSSCSLFALTSEKCPEYIDALVAEGMYPNFYENFKNHMIDFKKPTFPFMAFINMWMKLCTGYSMKKGPINTIEHYKKPLLMIHSRADKFSLPTTAVTLYEKAGSADKRICWFETGDHSKLRIEDTERYDGAIKDFLADINGKELQRAGAGEEERED